jgi:hypothetical protein
VRAKYRRSAAGCGVAFAILRLLSVDLAAQVAPAARQPNIVIILADDLRYGDLRSYNADSKIPTSHLDQLAAEGVRFTDAHSPSGVCTPTRYGLLTGRYAWRTTLKRSVLNGYSPLLIEPGRMTIASLLKQRGYETAAIGKWHLGLGATGPTDFSERLETPIRESIVHHSNDGTFAIRQGPWKLALALGSRGFSEPRDIVPKPGEAEGQLYDLEDDPGEERNVWLQNPQIVARLTALLKTYQDEGRSR